MYGGHVLITTDPAGASDPIPNPRGDPPIPSTPVSEVVGASPGSPRGGTGSPSSSSSATPRLSSSTGSSVAASGSSMLELSAVASDEAEPEQPTIRPHTRLQSGITKPKVYTDGTVRYANLCAVGEPTSVDEALKSSE